MLSSRHLLLTGCVAVWCALVGLGLHAMFAQETTSGELVDSPARWPEGSQLARGSDLTIAMFVQPDCPCSSASLDELAAITVARSTTIDVVFSRADVDVDRTALRFRSAASPGGAGLVDGALWQKAGRIPGAVRILDDGREAERFAARTSGYTVVYDRAGTRRFAGGITGSRGHVGDNLGRASVERIIAGLAGPSTHPVFGCALGSH